MPLCPAFTDSKKAFDIVETEAIIRATTVFLLNIAALENIMRHLEWKDLGVKADGRYLHHLRFAGDIVLITPNIEQAERVLAEFDKSEVNMMNDLAPELFRRKHVAWGAFKNIEGVVKKTKNIRFCAHLLDTAVLSALAYSSETCTLRKQDEHATQVQKGIRSSEFAKKSKIRWAGHIMRYSDDRWTRVLTDWIPGHQTNTRTAATRWPDFFTEALNVVFCERALYERVLHLVSLKRERFTGALKLVTGANDVTNARMRKSMINGTTGDTGSKEQGTKKALL
uniref:Reverse transcriptase domain-containing protein n=1 Tax=Haemonchus contortus TaxID=6289 RepID=A0A7I5EEQ2_HAECO